VAKRFAAGWAKAIEYIKANPAAARKHLAKNTLTPEDLVDVVPMLGYTMNKDMTGKQKEELQKFADFGVEIGVVPEKLDVQKFVKSF
jgi:NitT/TauT family transport system substrate-binding protein